MGLIPGGGTKVPHAMRHSQHTHTFGAFVYALTYLPSIFFTKLGPYCINCSVTFFFSHLAICHECLSVNILLCHLFFFPWMIIAVLFTVIAQTGYNQMPFTWWVNTQNVVYICTIEYCSAIKRNKLQITVTYAQNHYAEWKKPDPKV